MPKRHLEYEKAILHNNDNILIYYKQNAINFAGHIELKLIPYKALCSCNSK